MTSIADFHYGLPTPAEIEGLSGRQVLQAIIDGRLPQPPIAQTMTFWLIEVGDGYAGFEGEPGAHLLNPMGNVHGGWALTLMDSAGGCAAYSVLPADIGYATIETKGNFSRPITKDTGRVRAKARVVGKGRQIISTETKVLSRDGKLLAHGTSTLIVFGGAAR
jgi:uncharacterized protein (TIGR00369 family)